jgi:hypothetical protein
MFIQGRLQFIFRKSILTGILYHGPKAFPGFHQLFLRPAEINLTGIGCQFGYQAEMVGMQMGDKNISGFKVNTDGAQTGLHGFQALAAIQAGIDYQASGGTFDHIGIEIFQGAVGQWNFQPEQTGQ